MGALRKEVQRKISRKRIVITSGYPVIRAKRRQFDHLSGFAQFALSQKRVGFFAHFYLRLADGAFDLGVATMERGYAFYDSESKTRAAVVMRTRCVDAVEAVENAREMLRRDAATVIRNRDPHHPVIAAAFQIDVPASAGMG